MRGFHIAVAALATAAALASDLALGQAERPTFPLGDGPWVFETSEPVTRIRVSVVTKGLTHPFGLAFLPNGDMLVSERGGTLRLIHEGMLREEPIAGIPAVAATPPNALTDIALHPDFASNGWVYFLYAKPGDPPADAEYYASHAVGRGRFDGTSLTDVEDVFVADAWSTNPGGHGARLLFADDGTLFVTVPFRNEFDRVQDLSDHIGKILRLNDDGSVPSDNPFVGRADYKPEIYTYGHRVPQGLAFHPETGVLWAHEHGPLGGDELNILVPGGNYGWPLVSYGRDYDGTHISEHAWKEGLVEPELFWVPSISPSGMMFYTGDRFPGWEGNLFVGGMRFARMWGNGHIERIAFNENGEQRREWLLTELQQRIRDVKQGPDGLIYALTEEEDAALLRIEPAS